MPLVETDTGTQTATIGTEHTLATKTAVGVYVLLVDVANMAAGDTLELRAKVKVLTGSTAREAYLETFSGVQIQTDFISIPIPTAHSTAFTLKQTVGTGRSFDWSVVSL